MAEKLDRNVSGYSLKKQALKKWIYENNHTQPYVARMLGLPVVEFKQRLVDHALFDRMQLRSLIHLMGAEEAFKVIYFPTQDEKSRVFEEVFVAPKKKELGVR